MSPGPVKRVKSRKKGFHVILITEMLQQAMNYANKDPRLTREEAHQTRY